MFHGENAVVSIDAFSFTDPNGANCVRLKIIYIAMAAADKF
jgi:hypothetical protein